MKTYTYIPTGDVFQTKSVKAIVTYLRKNSRFFVDETDKEYMKGYSNRGSLLGQSIRFDKEENFVSDLMKLGQIKEGDVLPKGGRAMKGSTKGSSKAVSVKKKIGSTDSIISLSKIKDFAESIKQVERDKFKRSRKIQKFIEANTTLVNAEDLTKGSTIWVFSGAPQYYIGRAKLEYKSSSKSPNFVTLYLTDDNKYEEWRKADSYENSMKDFDQISIPAIRFGEGKYYKSVKKDKKIPLG